LLHKRFFGHKIADRTENLSVREELAFS